MEIDDFLKENREYIIRECASGVKGDCILPVSTICIALTNRCNLHCIMCQYCSKEYSNKTYNNEEPFSITIDQYKELFTKELVERMYSEGDARSIDGGLPSVLFTHGESFLNKDIHGIILHTRRIMPIGYIQITTNGTISPYAIEGGEDLLKHVNIICFSIDGCTKETFEEIRTPANFETVLQNLKDWTSISKKLNRKKPFRIAIVLSKKNIHELPGIVKMAAELGSFESIYIQPLLVNQKHSHLESMKLEYIEKNLLIGAISEAQNIASREGIRLDFAVSPDILISQANNSIEQKPNYNNYMQYCSYFRNGFIEINPDGAIREICCNMTPEDNAYLMDKYNLSNNDYGFDAYNSIGYWQLRQDLINGKLEKYCRNCQLGYYDGLKYTQNHYKYHLEDKKELSSKIITLRKLLLKQENENKLSKDSIGNLKNTNAELQKILKQEEQEKTMYLSCMESLEKRVKQLENEKIQLIGKNKSLEEQIYLIFNSFSWKITEPLRIIKKAYKNRRKHGNK
ncbi:radical SAM protein [Aminipila butyrica]|uniref:Radical SAM protein n=1 Tax=Aminipila butyrica TaxID=433296 RepID=A0A858BQM4_9FIRM|nr:radical SAM protein [Aminipila butyrica]QIB68171.1 radical SAM protein [Aminipila butyrica]